MIEMYIYNLLKVTKNIFGLVIDEASFTERFYDWLVAHYCKTMFPASKGGYMLISLMQNNVHHHHGDNWLSLSVNYLSNNQSTLLITL